MELQSTGYRVEEHGRPLRVHVQSATGVEIIPGLGNKGWNPRLVSQFLGPGEHARPTVTNNSMV